VNVSEKREVMLVLEKQKLRVIFFKKISFILYLCNCRKSTKKIVQEV